MKNNKNVEKRKRVMAIILIYVAFSVIGLLMLKMGTMKAFSLTFDNGDFDFKISGVLILGLLFYLMALVTSLIAMKTIDLNIFYPVSAGLGYVLVCLLSYFVLKEQITKKQLIGTLFILVGVILMNLRRSI